MKNTTKGALAAGAAAVLLMGGAGTLAYWTDSQSVASTSITSGNLALGTPTCSSWVYDGTSTTVVKFVPGDVVSRTCSFSVTATGDHISASVTAPNAVNSGTGPASSSATVTTAYTLGGTAFTNGSTITKNDDGKTLVATFKVAFPFGTDETGSPKVNANDTRSWTIALDALTVKLTQTQTSSNPTT